MSVSFFGVALGAVLFIVGWQAIRDGTMVRGSASSLPLTGWEACALAAVMMSMGLWMLWRFWTGRQ